MELSSTLLLFSSTIETEPKQPYDTTLQYCVIIAFNICFVAPIGIWLTRRYYQTCRTYPYCARRPKLVIFQNLFTLFFVSIYIPLHIIFFEILWDNNDTYAEWWDIASYNLTLAAVSVSLSLRVWHSAYDFELAHHSGRQWKSIISEDIRGDQQSFFFRHKNFFGVSFDTQFLPISPDFCICDAEFIYKCDAGNPRKTYLWFMLLPYGGFLALMPPFIKFHVFDEKEMYIVTAVLLLLIVAFTHVIILVVTIRTWNTVHDLIHVRGELILQTAVSWLSYFIYLSIHLCDVTNLFDDGDELYDSVWYLGYFANDSIGALLVIIIGTQYLPFRMWQKGGQCCTCLHRKAKRTVSDCGMFVEQTFIDFQSVITMCGGLQAFMDHLAKVNQQNCLIVE